MKPQRQMNMLTKGQETVAVIRKQKFQQRKEKAKTAQTKCNRCGLSPNHDNCPALGQLCWKCNKPNHFAAVCHTKIGTQRNYRSGKKGNSDTFSNAATPDRGKRVNALENQEAGEFFIDQSK